MSAGAIIILLTVVFWLAWSNGANDNFKGVATLYGSGTATFRGALLWATGATLAGSLVSVYMAQVLVKRFAGAGIVPVDQIDGTWLIAVGASGAATILAATFLGMPTSTTHALTGALIGAALAVRPGAIQWHAAWTKLAQPLLLSPIIAVGAAAIVYAILHRARLALGVERHTCICIGKSAPQPVILQSDGTAALMDASPGALRIDIDEVDRCVERYSGRVIGVDAQRAVGAAHYASGAAVCFARAVNDTPKIAALLLATSIATSFTWTAGSLVLVAVAMGLGGVLQGRKVAETIGKRITDLNPGQGLAANLVTSALVLLASRLGMPVSTTHVSCGSIFGIGLVNKRMRWRTVAQVGVTWVTTLPVGLALGFAAYRILQLAVV